MLQPPFENIEDLHEYVFQILLKIHEEDNNFRFTMRQPHQFIKGKMKHWFYSNNEKSLYFSCWQNKYTEPQPHIYFSIDMQGELSLHLNSSSSDNLRKIAISHIYKAITGENINSSHSSFNIPLHEIKESEDFKIKWKLIDDYIVKLGSSNTFMTVIDFQDFEKRLNYIQKKRGEFLQINQKKHQAHNTKLKHLSLENIGHFSKLDIGLSHKITCLIGENGSGKSTILKALALALTGVAPERIDAKHKSVYNFLKIKGIDSKTNRENYELKGEIRLIYDEHEQNLVLFQFQSGDLVVKEEGEYKNIQDIYYFPHLILGFPQFQGKTNNGNSISIINRNWANVKDLRGLIYNEPDNRFDEFNQWIANLFATSNKKKAIGNQKTPIEDDIITKVFQIVSEVTAQKVEFITVSDDAEKVWVRTDDAPSGIPLSLISQGYNNVFGWIGYFMKRLAEVNPDAKDFAMCPAILLIDEIDTYLHPKWQVNILAVLLQHFPNTQIIVTTHSPYIVGGIPNEHLRIYICQKEGEVEEFREFQPYGANLERLSEKIFGVKGRYVKVVQEKLEKLSSLIHQGELLAAKHSLENDFKDIDENDMELQRYKMLIRTKEILAQ